MRLSQNTAKWKTVSAYCFHTSVCDLSKIDATLVINWRTTLVSARHLPPLPLLPLHRSRRSRRRHPILMRYTWPLWQDSTHLDKALGGPNGTLHGQCMSQLWKLISTPAGATATARTLRFISAPIVRQNRWPIWIVWIAHNNGQMTVDCWKDLIKFLPTIQMGWRNLICASFRFVGLTVNTENENEKKTWQRQQQLKCSFSNERQQ